MSVGTDIAVVTAIGTNLDRLAYDHYNLRRHPGEPDASFRKRIMRSSGFYDGPIRVGPIHICDRSELDKIYAMLRWCAEGKTNLRDTLGSIINMQGLCDVGRIAVGVSKEQVLYDVGQAFIKEGIVIEGVELPSGQRTKVRVDRTALDVWYAAMTLILDDDEE